MTDVVFHPTTGASGIASRLARFAVRLGRPLYRAMIAFYIRRALEALPDRLLKDIGLTRADIPSVAAAFAPGEEDATRDAFDRLNWTESERDAACRLPRFVLYFALVATAALLFVLKLVPISGRYGT